MSKAYKNMEINTVICTSKLTKLVTLLKELIKATRQYGFEAQCERMASLNHSLDTTITYQDSIINIQSML